jgi:uncharacterized glyoxalase superfamily protein PhnB
MFWGNRMVRLCNPDGYHWSFATTTGDFNRSRTAAMQ